MTDASDVDLPQVRDDSDCGPAMPQLQVPGAQGGNMTKLWTWLKARWKWAVGGLGILAGSLCFWRVRKPHLPWDDDPTPVDVLTPQEGAIRKQEIEAAAEAERAKLKAKMEAERKRALQAINRGGKR